MKGYQHTLFLEVVIEHHDLLVVFIFFNVLKRRSSSQQELINSLPEMVIDDGHYAKDSSDGASGRLEEPGLGQETIPFFSKEPEEAIEMN